MGPEDHSENEPVHRVFRHCPRCGSPIRPAEITNRRLICSHCDQTVYFNQASAVAALIRNKEERFLFLRRERSPSKGKLCFPGGFIDPGESAEEAIARETKEEVNLEITACQYLCSFPNNYAYRGIIYPVTDLFFLAEVASFAPLTPEKSEVSEIEFRSLTPETLSQLAFPSLQAAIDCFLRGSSQAANLD